jgi:hypothetical protein
MFDWKDLDSLGKMKIGALLTAVVFSWLALPILWKNSLAVALAVTILFGGIVAALLWTQILVQRPKAAPQVVSRPIRVVVEVFSNALEAMAQLFSAILQSVVGCLGLILALGLGLAAIYAFVKFIKWAWES